MMNASVDDGGVLTREELEAMTLSELRPLAQSLGVVGYSTLNKTPLIDAILLAQMGGV